jgi:aryl carrier-like protein
MADTPTDEYRSTLRAALSVLRQVLPPYMVPSAILPLSFLPRTITGKIDRRSLREWSGRQTLDEILKFHQERTIFRGPSTEAERIVQESCEEVLHLAPGSVGLEDNFFGLGGNSLTAQQLAAASRSRGLRIGVTDVFEKPSLGALAATGTPCSFTICEEKKSRLDHTSSKHPFEALKKDLLQSVVLPQGFKPEDVEDVYPTLEMQSLLVDLTVIDYFPVEINGPIDYDRLRRACQLFVDVQPSFRSIFFPFQGKTMQIVLRKIAITWNQLTLATGADLMAWARSWALQDRTQPAALSQPSAAFTLIQSNDGQRSAFILKMPHAQYDGVCLRQIIQQLGELYKDPGLAVTHRTLANFTTYRLACARLRTTAALNFWAALLAGSGVTRLPRLSPGSETSIIYSGECEPPLPPTGITMATAIKAAWAFVLAQETNSTDVVFGQITNCRGNIDIGRDVDERSGQDIIGMCLNTTPVRVKLASTMRIKQLLLAVQEEHVRMLPYETIDWFDMVTNSTPWPADTDLDSVVLHENFSSAGNLALGETTGCMDNPIFTTPGWKRHVLVTWPGPDKLMTFLMTREGALGKEYAEGLVGKFNATLMRFLGDPEGVVGRESSALITPRNDS